MNRNLTVQQLLSWVSLGLTLLVGQTAYALSYNVSAWTTTHPGGPGDFSGSFQPLGDFGLLAVVSTSSDYTNGKISATADAAAFGSDSSVGACVVCEGRGIEPMAHTAAETVYDDPLFFGFEPAIAVASIEIVHRFRLTDDAPSGDWIVAIPMFLEYRLDSSGGDGVLTSAGFLVDAPGLTSIYSLNVKNGESRSGKLSFNSSAFDLISIGVGASAEAQYVDIFNEQTQRAERRGVGASAVADPFLFVDPGWEYAPYVLVEQESIENLGTWVQVTRAWRDTAVDAPVPGTLALFGIGLAGVGAVRRHRAVA